MFLNVTRSRERASLSVTPTRLNGIKSFNLKGGTRAVSTKTDSPYFYVIRHRKSGKLYLGARWAKGANPTMFGDTYRTSSPKVHRIGFENFETVCVVARADAREFEGRILRQLFEILGSDEFCRLLVNRHICTGYIPSAEQKAAVSSAMKGVSKTFDQREKISASVREANGLDTERGASLRKRKSAALTGRSLSDSHCVALSTALTGRKLSASHRENIAKAQLGTVKGPRSAETKERMSRAHKARLDPNTVEGRASRKARSEATKLWKRVACSHCGLECSPTNLVRWHGDNCKHK